MDKFKEFYPDDKISILIDESGGKLTKDIIYKKFLVDELTGKVCDWMMKYFDYDSYELLDLKIEVLTALKEGKVIAQIPRFYDIFELLPPEGQIWD